MKRLFIKRYKKGEVIKVYYNSLINDNINFQLSN